MKRNPPKPIKDDALKQFDDLPAKTKDLMTLGDSEAHAVGQEKAVIQQTIRKRAKQ